MKSIRISPPHVPPQDDDKDKDVENFDTAQQVTAQDPQFEEGSQDLSEDTK